MKKIKILPALLLSLALLLAPLSVGAESTFEEDGQTENAATPAETGENPTPVTDTEITGAGQTEKEDSGTANKNPFETVLTELSEYATEIICTVTLVASLLLAYAYRKGLLPLITGAISAISSTLSGVKSQTEAEGRALGDGIERLSSVAEAQEERLERWDGALKDACAALSEVAEECKSTAKIKTVLCEEVELLYDIFMSSSLPQYKKDAVAERIARIKKELDGDAE